MSRAKPAINAATVPSERFESRFVVCQLINHGRNQNRGVEQRAHSVDAPTGMHSANMALGADELGHINSRGRAAVMDQDAVLSNQ